ncbi:MAG: hypothetical protein WCJ56_06540 [bacterium]
MSLSKNNVKKGYTYADYATWNDDERWEIINGRAYHMSFAPTEEELNISKESSQRDADSLHNK